MFLKRDMYLMLDNHINPPLKAINNKNVCGFKYIKLLQIANG